MKEQENALTLVEPKPISPLPVFSGVQMSEALDAYKKLQTALDKSMSDQLMTIQGRTFRKKGYWRAIRTSFNLQVECISEERIEQGDDWGYLATYRATASNGSSADGDGSCMASEKTVYKKEWVKNKKISVLDSDGNPLVDKFATEKNATIHNVRSHAHTRAFNRSVSNLVGFGEVSAEEINHQADEKPTRQEKQKTAQQKADNTAQPVDGSFTEVPEFAKDGEDLVEVSAEYERDTAKSLLFTINGKSVWMPKSQTKEYSATHMHCTEWIANQKEADGEIPPGWAIAVGHDHNQNHYEPGEHPDEQPPPYTDDDIPR